MLLSIIVPVYNGENYIDRCIESIEKAGTVLKEAEEFKNDEPEIQVIIINDGSTDNTADRCMRLTKTYENVMVLTLNDEGVSVARNRGLELATGEYVTFVDADDVVCEDMFLRLIGALKDHDADIAGCEFYTFTDVAGISKIINSVDAETIAIHDYATFLEHELLNGNTRVWSKIYRRKVLSDISFKKGLSIGEDMLFVNDAAMHSSAIVEIKGYKGYGYYLNEKGAMKRAFTPAYMDQITCWEMLKERLLECKNDIYVRIDSKILESIMLVAGKISALSKEDREKNAKYIKLCHDKVCEILKLNKGAVKKLSIDYQVKVKAFKVSPGAYMNIYYHLKG